MPPPDKAPVHEVAETLGIVDGLRAERSRHDQWRCGCCHRMQRGGEWQVWVPDGMRHGDPDWSFTEAGRQNAYNGHWTGWCLPCAPKKIKPKCPATVQATSAVNPTSQHVPWWRLLLRAFRSA